MVSTVASSTAASSSRHDSAEDIIYDVGCSVVGLAAIIGNVTLIHLFRTHENLRTMTHHFVVALAISDLLFGAVFVPVRLLTVHGVFGESEFICLAGIVLTKLPLMVSAMLLIAIAVERYIQFVYPLRHADVVTRKRVLIVIGVIWIYALFLTALPLVGWNNIKEREESGLVWDIEECTNNRVYQGGLLALIFYGHVFPMMLAMSFLYWRIFRAAANHITRMVTMELNFDEQERHSKLAKEKRGLSILVIIVAYFALSWTPIGVMLLIDFKGFTVGMVVQPIVPPSAYTVGSLLAVGNAAVNPFLYGLANIRFRRALCLSLGCHEHANKYGTPSSSRAQSLQVLNKLGK